MCISEYHFSVPYFQMALPIPMAQNRQLWQVVHYFTALAASFPYPQTLISGFYTLNIKTLNFHLSPQHPPP